jgi:selenide,water dikinase
MEGALEAARAGVGNAGQPRNEAFAGPSVTIEDGVAPEIVGLAYDPQTSGGLLVTLPADRGVGLQAALASSGLLLQRVGRVEAGAGVALTA